jgi:DNA-binding transcriptional MocR family regulator
MARPPAKAQRLADALSDQIRSGQLPAGTWLPAERQLADTHRVGRSTVRHALQMLCNTGLVEAVPGTGNRVYGHAGEGPAVVSEPCECLEDAIDIAEGWLMDAPNSDDTYTHRIIPADELLRLVQRLNAAANPSGHPR